MLKTIPVIGPVASIEIVDEEQDGKKIQKENQDGSEKESV